MSIRRAPRAAQVARAIALPSALLAMVAVVVPAQSQVVGGGICKFDIAQLAFVGTAAEQASCLLRPPARWGHLKPQPITLPDALKQRVGQPITITKASLRSHLASLGLSEASVGGSLDEPLSRAKDNDPGAPMARYFVIHDTSAPYFGDAAFPADIDTNAAINRLDGYAGPNSVAHAFVNRTGKTLIGHPFATPWRATVLESKVIETPSKGLFIHIENVQPRRRDPAGGPSNDAIAPIPGFSDAQYATLALLYVTASVRAGQWMIPAFHAAIDEGLPDAHDDPQNFDLAGKFAPALQSLISKLGG